MLADWTGIIELPVPDRQASGFMTTDHHGEVILLCKARFDSAYSALQCHLPAPTIRHLGSLISGAIIFVQRQTGEK